MTKTGRIVYDRPVHYFNLKDVIRIVKAVMLDEEITLSIFANLLEAISELLTELIKKIIRESTNEYPLLQVFVEFAFKIMDLVKEYVRDRAADLWTWLKSFFGSDE
jgi:hypothetical protein